MMQEGKSASVEPTPKQPDSTVSDAVELKTLLLKERTSVGDMKEQLQIATHRGARLVLYHTSISQKHSPCFLYDLDDLVWSVRTLEQELQKAQSQITALKLQGACCIL